MIVGCQPEELDRVPRAVAIGTFDGVHRGHRAVISAAVATGLRAAVITFDPHPRAVLRGGVKLLTTLERRLGLLESLGVAEVLVLRFTRELAEIPAERWAERCIGGLGAREIFVGDDFRFGRGRGGDARLLRRLGFRVHAVPMLAGTSATRVHDCLSRGDVVEAARLLGRMPELELRPLGAMPGSGSIKAAADRDLLVPGPGRYRGFADRREVEISIEPHLPTEGARYVHIRGLAPNGCGLRPPLRVELAERLDARATRGSPPGRDHTDAELTQEAR